MHSVRYAVTRLVEFPLRAVDSTYDYKPRTLALDASGDNLYVSLEDGSNGYHRIFKICLYNCPVTPAPVPNPSGSGGGTAAGGGGTAAGGGGGAVGGGGGGAAGGGLTTGEITAIVTVLGSTSIVAVVSITWRCCVRKGEEEKYVNAFDSVTRRTGAAACRCCRCSHRRAHAGARRPSPPRAALAPTHAPALPPSHALPHAGAHSNTPSLNVIAGVYGSTSAKIGPEMASSPLTHGEVTDAPDPAVV